METRLNPASQKIETIFDFFSYHQKGFENNKNR